MSTPDMAAWRALTDIKARNLHLNIPNTCYRFEYITSVLFLIKVGKLFSVFSETDTETTPCITVTPPPSEAWQWSAQRKININNNNGDNSKLSPHNIHDVQL